MITVHSKAETANIDDGARLVFIVNAADVGKLQDELRLHARHMASGTCQMGEHATSPAPPESDPTPASPDPVDRKAVLLAAEAAAFEKAKPVFDANCASCHTKGGRMAKAKSLD